MDYGSIQAVDAPEPTVAPVSDRPGLAVPTAQEPIQAGHPATLASVWWLGCASGVGTSTVAYLTGLGRDGGRRLPDVLEHGSVVVLVTGTKSMHMIAATRMVDAWATTPGTAPVLGMVVVDSYPGRPPRIVVERLARLTMVARCRWSLPRWRVWKVPWIKALTAASHPDEVGAHPAIAAIAADVTALAPRAAITYASTG